MQGLLKGSNFYKIYLSLLLLLVVTLIGTTGYIVIEHYSFIDALYMTVITVATVGYGEVHQLSDAGRLFTIFLIISSFGTFAFAITSLSNYIISGEFNRYYKNKRVTLSIGKLEGHVVICGFGRNGRQAAQQLQSHKVPFVIIEKNTELVNSIKGSEYLYVEGDATQDEIFFKANIKKARAVIATLPNDADNLFIVLTARTANNKLTIISRASDDNSDKKLKAAGANNVIMPDKIGGAHMASLVLKPDVIEFLDYITGQGGLTINLVEITFDNLPEHFQNKTIRELEIRNKSGANIVGFKTAGGEYIINPSPETKIIPKAKIFVLGTQVQIDKMKEILS